MSGLRAGSVWISPSAGLVGELLKAGRLVMPAHLAANSDFGNDQLLG
jgi:hypothetical protein